MSNAQKTPLSRTLSLFGQRKALDEIAKRGQALPGHVTSVVGQIVTVNFDMSGLTLPQVSMPVYGSEYIRLPIQNGDKGVAFPASVYIGGVSGLGAGTGDDTLQGNLSTLVWVPVGNANWSTVDENAVTIYGPNGVVLRDTESNSVETLTPSQIELDTPVASTTQNFVAGNGASGSFTTPTGQTVTVQDGIIVNIF